MRRYLQSTARRAQAEKIPSGSILSAQVRCSSTSSSSDYVPPHRSPKHSTRPNSTLDKGKDPAQEHAQRQYDPADSRAYGLKGHRLAQANFENKKWSKYAPRSPNASVRHRNPDFEKDTAKQSKHKENAFQPGATDPPNDGFSAPPLSKKSSKPDAQSPTPSTSRVSAETLVQLLRRDGEPTQFPCLDGNLDPLRSELENQRVRTPSKENQEWVAAEQDGVMDAEEDAAAMYFTPGTLVEIRKNGHVMEAIVIHQTTAQRRLRLISLCSTGETIGHVHTDVHFSIPNYISADLAERCGSRILHENPQQLEARVAALKQLQLIVNDAETASYGAKNIERHRHLNIYNHCKSPDPNKWGKVSVADITKLVYVQPTALDYFGMHKYLMRLSLRYVASPDYHKTQTFYVRPENDVQEIQLVKDMIATHQISGGTTGPYSQFITKARNILRSSRKPFQGDSQEKGPIKQEPPTAQFNENDKVFASFLLRSMQPYVTNQTDPYTICRSQILKDLLKNEKCVEYTDAMVHEVLIRLGVIPAWKNLTELLPNVNNGYNFEMAPFVPQNNDSLVTRGIKSTPTAGKVLGPEDFHRTDPLESVRHDFGDMPAYVIDDLTAEELDDGVSIEKVAGEPENCWIHVHIADPASVIHPGHALVRMAKEQGQSLYFINQTFPLFPKLLMHHPVYGMSLGDGKKHGRPDKCITFSAKLDGQGNILDYKVTAGLLRNVKKLSYASVDKALGLKPVEPTTPFGGSAGVIAGPSPDDADVGPLKEIYRISKILERKRFESGCLVPASSSVELRSSPIPSGINSISISGSKYSGFPDISYRVNNVMDYDTGAHSLVAEMMKLGCTVASMVARDNNLPVVRRGADPMLFVDEEARQRVLKSRSHQGYFKLVEHLNSISLMSSARNSTALMAHGALGVTKEHGYSRVTSPLRRFQDLVSHWQFHHLLLGSKSSARAPLSFMEMEDLISETTVRERVAGALHKRNTELFALIFIKRWLADTAKGVKRPFADPMEDLEGYLVHGVRRNSITNSYGAMVEIPKLGLRMHLVDLRVEHEPLPASTKVRIQAKKIDLGVQRPMLQATLKEIISVP